MKNLIKADLRRIFKRKSLYICIVLLLASLIRALLLALSESGFNATGIINGMHDGLGAAIGKLLITIPVFFAVFAHEQSSKSMLCVLGHGLTRGRIIAAKLLEAAILIMIYFIPVTGLYAILIGDGTETGMSPDQMGCAYIFILLAAFRLFGYIAFTALIFFLSTSTTVGVIACVLFSYLFDRILLITEMFVDLSLRDYTFDGQLDWAYLTIEAGGFGYQIITAALFVAAAIAATVIFYQRKELEF